MEQQRLIRLLEDFGFKEHGTKESATGLSWSTSAI